MSVGFYAMRSMLQGIGDSKTPLYFLAASVVLTAGMDPVLMFGWLGAPRLGLNGTAWASGIAQLVTLLALLSWLRRRKNPVAPYWGWRSFHWPTAWTTVRIGTPSACQQSVVSLGMAFVMGIVNGFGMESTAAFGAAMRVDQLAFMPAFAFGLAISPLAGQNIGANRPHRVRSIFLWGCLLSGGITATVSVLVVSMPRTILRMFLNDGPVMDIGANYLRTVAPCYLFFAIMFVSNGIINGSGHTLVTTIISFVSQWAVRVPVAEYLSRWMGSVQGVWYAMAMSFGVSMLASLGYYLTGGWRRPVVRQRPVPPASPSDVLAEETGEV
jgi:putative MATE family efflux protein